MELNLTDRIVITSKFSNGEVFYWNAQVYSKIKELGLRAHKLFSEVNSFFNQLPPSKLAAVENYYRTVQEIIGKSNARFSTVDTEYSAIVDEITKELTAATAELFNTVTLDDITAWSKTVPIKVPDSIATVHSGLYSIEGTYLVEDYKRLWCLCVAIRMVLPVWCEYINIINDVISSSKHEVACIGLLRDCDGIMNSDAMNKLRDYVNEKCTLEISKVSTAILNGLSRSEIPEWVISMTIVKRLGIGEISSNEDRSHLVTSIFGYIQGILTRDLDRKNTGRVRDKFAFLTNDEDNDKHSLIEQYRVRQDITEGDVILFETYILQYPERAALDLVKYRNFSAEETERYVDKVRKCVSYSSTLNVVKLIQAQNCILAWTVNDIVPYQLLDRLSPTAFKVLLGISQAYIWHFNLPDIAVALTAYHDTSLENNLLLNSPNARVSPNMHQRLSTLYKHSHPRSVSENAQPNLNSENVGVNPIREVIRGLNNGMFTARAPEELWSTATSYQKSGRVIFRNISEQLVSLIETINETN